jgi:hypothetical protein
VLIAVCVVIGDATCCRVEEQVMTDEADAPQMQSGPNFLTRLKGVWSKGGLIYLAAGREISKQTQFLLGGSAALIFVPLVEAKGLHIGFGGAAVYFVAWGLIFRIRGALGSDRNSGRGVPPADSST